jgi:hypothetical protein
MMRPLVGATVLDVQNARTCTKKETAWPVFSGVRLMRPFASSTRWLVLTIATASLLAYSTPVSAGEVLTVDVTVNMPSFSADTQGLLWFYFDPNNNLPYDTATAQINIQSNNVTWSGQAPSPSIKNDGTQDLDNDGSDKTAIPITITAGKSSITFDIRITGAAIDTPTKNSNGSAFDVLLTQSTQKKGVYPALVGASSTVFGFTLQGSATPTNIINPLAENVTITPAGSPAAIPEPSTILMAAMVSLLLFLVRIHDGPRSTPPGDSI